MQLTPCSKAYRRPRELGDAGARKDKGQLCSAPAPHPGSAAAGARRGGEPPRKAIPGVNTSEERNVLGTACLGHWSCVQPAGVN